MLETLDHTIRIGSTPTFLYFDLYLYSAYAAHYVYFNVDNWNDNCEAKSEGKSPRPLRGLQVDSSLARNVSYAVR